MNRRLFLSHLVALVLLAAVTVSAAAASTVRAAAPVPIVTVVKHGGLCLRRSECQTVFHIYDNTIVAEGYVPAHLSPRDRAALLRAIEELQVRYFRAHPFKGTCPTAYDAQEAVYQFRGFSPRLPGCTYNLRGVDAVRITERLLGMLRHK